MGKNNNKLHWLSCQLLETFFRRFAVQTNLMSAQQQQHIKRETLEKKVENTMVWPMPEVGIALN